MVDDDTEQKALEWASDNLRDWDGKKGWKWLEEKLGGKDDGEMKKHSDDIDTILIVVRTQCLPCALI